MTKRWSAKNLKYALAAEDPGHWRADVFALALKSKGIDAVLVEEAVYHLTHVTSFAPVKIFVPKENVKEARELIEKYYIDQENTKEKPGMANKKKIEERLQVLQAKKAEQRMRMFGLSVIILVLLLLGIMFLRNESSAIPENLISTSTPVYKQYDAYPPMTIDPAKKYLATVKMAKGGEFVIQLFPDKAPLAVNSFVFLARDGYFDGVTFHRVLDGFMAQGGDPSGTGGGGPGYEFDNELNDLSFDKAGVVAMANSGPNTNGSQFFIMFNAYGLSEKDYTIFGQVIEGMDVVDGITRRDPDSNPDFPGDAIKSITITEE